MKCDYKKCACYFQKSSGMRNCYLYHSDAGVLKCHVRITQEHIPIITYVHKHPQIRKARGKTNEKRNKENTKI